MILSVDDDGERCLIGILADIGILPPGELVAGHPLAGGSLPGEPKIGGVGQNGGEKGTFVGAAFAGAQVCVMSSMRGRRRASASARRRLHVEDSTTRGERKEKRALLLV